MKDRVFVRSGRTLTLAAGAALALAACSTTRLPDAPTKVGETVKANPHYKVGAPYEIEGRWYVPKVDNAYAEEGLASWYGDKFHGKLTANGEIFDKRRMSAAHKTLPMPTVVEVENLENGRVISVRVNDRGPFVGDRIIDLSHAAADALGFTAQGTARVRVRYIRDTDVNGVAALPGGTVSAPARVASGPSAVAPTMLDAPIVSPVENEPDLIAGLIEASGGPAPQRVPASPVSPPAARGEMWVEIAQVASLNALETMRLDFDGADELEIQSKEVDGRQVHVLRLGPFFDESWASASLSRARAAGYAGARIIRGIGG